MSEGIEAVYDKIDPKWKEKATQQVEEKLQRIKLVPRGMGSEIIGRNVDISIGVDVVVDGDVLFTIEQKSYEKTFLDVLMWPKGKKWKIYDADIRFYGSANRIVFKKVGSR